MVELRFEADIEATAERVFSLLVELRDYDRWLPPSSAFHGTTRISDGPIGIGTTYVEPGPFGTRHGVVTALVRPTQLDFEQPMTLRPRFLGVLGIRLFHTLTPAGTLRASAAAAGADAAGTGGGTHGSGHPRLPRRKPADDDHAQSLRRT